MIKLLGSLDELFNLEALKRYKREWQKRVQIYPRYKI